MKLVHVVKESVIDREFLYELLKEREPHVNISHKTMPTWEEHSKFVQNHPYVDWYIIHNDVGDRVGTVYVQYNEIAKGFEVGLFIKKQYQRDGYGTWALYEITHNGVMYSGHGKVRYLANIAPENYASQEFFQKNGFKLIQYTFEKDRTGEPHE